MSRHHDQQEELLALGQDIAVKAGVLTACIDHPDQLFQTGNDEASAYALASLMATVDCSRSDNIAGVYSALQNSPMDYCPICDQIDHE